MDMATSPGTVPPIDHGNYERLIARARTVEAMPTAIATAA